MHRLADGSWSQAAALPARSSSGRSRAVGGVQARSQLLLYILTGLSPVATPTACSYANAKVYQCPSCERPSCYRTYSSSKEDSPPCDL